VLEDIDTRDLGALAFEQIRRRGTDPARDACDDTDFSVQPHLMPSFPAGPTLDHDTRQLPVGVAGATPVAGAAAPAPDSDSSIVRTGPLNVCRADIRNQSVTATITTIVTSGA